jgi:hypothetical protein
MLPGEMLYYRVEGPSFSVLFGVKLAILMVFFNALIQDRRAFYKREASALYTTMCKVIHLHRDGCGVLRSIV